MNMDSGQIDRIVREVMRQLMSLDSASSVRVPAESLTVAVPPSAESLPVAVPATLVVAERVITMASLSGRLAGVKRVQVRPHAVVTPLVSDVLREQGIQLERQLPVAAAGSSDNPSILLVADDTQAQRVTGLLNQLTPDWRRCLHAEEAFAQVANAADRRAIVLTTQWARVVCQANRDPQLRAAAVNSAQTVRQACRQLDANCVAIDATSLTGDQLQDVVREFVICATTAVQGTARVLSRGTPGIKSDK